MSTVNSTEKTRRVPPSGTTVCHFKRGLVSPDALTAEPLLYLYTVVGVATDTDTDAPCVVYRAQYGDRHLYVRRLDDFLSSVDRDKYPEAKQNYRFTWDENAE